jgi:hypothetical protein
MEQHFKGVHGFTGGAAQRVQLQAPVRDGGIRHDATEAGDGLAKRQAFQRCGQRK